MSTKYLSPGGLNKSDEVYEIRVRSIIYCKMYTHCWVEIETMKAWYCAQFDSDHCLTLTEHSSLNEVTERGKEAVYCNGISKNVSNKRTYKPNGRTMRDIVSFMKYFDGNYHFINNNSEHFAYALHKWI